MVSEFEPGKRMDIDTSDRKLRQGPILIDMHAQRGITPATLRPALPRNRMYASIAWITSGK